MTLGPFRMFASGSITMPQQLLYTKGGTQGSTLLSLFMCFHHLCFPLQTPGKEWFLLWKTRAEEIKVDTLHTLSYSIFIGSRGEHRWRLFTTLHKKTLLLPLSSQSHDLLENLKWVIRGLSSN